MKKINSFKHLSPHKNVVIIGNGKSALDCVKVIQQYNCGNPDVHCNLVAVVTDTTNTEIGSDTDLFYESNGINHIKTDSINSEKFIKKLPELKIDLIYSINNFQIIKEKLLKIPKNGIINFHNAPLPKYGGLNGCTWAIVKGEKKYGVTWHFVEVGIDSGDIIAQRIFPINEDTTAIQLIMKCIQEGVFLFKEILPKIMNDKIERTMQDPSKRLYYRKNEIPNSGNVDFSWNFKQFNNFIRGLNFNPFSNLLVYPKAYYGNREFYIDKVELVKYALNKNPGKLIKVTDKSLWFALPDAVAALTHVRNNKKRITKLNEFIAEYKVENNKFFTAAQ